jgi:hypothetical protein
MPGLPHFPFLRHQKSARASILWPGFVGRRGGLVSWSRRIGPHVTLPADREPSPRCAVSRLPRLTPASLRGELLVLHHPASRPGRWWCKGGVGPLALALTRGW